MKLISTIQSLKLTTFDGPSGELNMQSWDEILKPININKIRLLDCFSTIESMINQIITFYFLGHPSEKKGSRRHEFENLILTSDWCTFASKRKLITHILNDLNPLIGKQKTEYERLLKKCMSYRNAFIHGELLTDMKIVKLCYFEGSPKEITLDDRYFETLETTLNNCVNMTQQIMLNIGATIAHKLG